MGVALAVARWLRSEQHDVTHLREEGLLTLPDADVFEKAKREQRTVLTFDLDFGEIAAVARSGQPSVVILRLRNTRSPHVIERLRAALPRVEGDLAGGAVVIVEESRIRVRSLPIGRDEGT